MNEAEKEYMIYEIIKLKEKRMKEDEGFEEFKKEAGIMMEKDIKKVIKSFRNIPKNEHIVLKELAKTSLMKEVLQTIWVTAFHKGTKQAVIEYNRKRKNK